MAEGEETFEKLDPDVQKFLGRLDGDDVRLLEKSIDLCRKIVNTASVIRWIVITIGALIVAVAGFGDAIAKMTKWVIGAPH